jgi:uncharacterized membrane protein YphA (DoxX/SURF4 family)
MKPQHIKITYWIATGLLALFILPGIFFINDPFAIEGSASLGIPYWLHLEVGIGKFIGGLLLIFPFVPRRIKEWAYVAFGIDFISAFIGHVAVFGMRAEALFPVVVFILLIVSYWSFHRMRLITVVPQQAMEKRAFA